MSSGFISVNGADIYYETAGNGQPIVFVHGMGLDHRMWDAQFTEFSKKHFVIRYDLRGFGKSSLPAENYAHHTDLHALLNHLGISRANLVGLSMGGRVVIDFALTYPEMVSSLIPVDSVIHGHQNKQLSTAAIAKAASEGVALAANEAWLNHELFAPARRDPKVATALSHMIGEYSGWHWVNKNPWVPIDPPAATQLSRITAPTLVIVGEEDLPDFIDMSHLLHEQVAGSQMEVIRGAGHMSNMEDPVTFNKLVAGFISKTGA